MTPRPWSDIPSFFTLETGLATDISAYRLYFYKSMQDDQEGDPGDQYKKWHQKMTVGYDRLHAAKEIHLKTLPSYSNTIKSKRLR